MLGQTLMLESLIFFLSLILLFVLLYDDLITSWITGEQLFSHGRICFVKPFWKLLNKLYAEVKLYSLFYNSRAGRSWLYVTQDFTLLTLVEQSPAHMCPRIHLNSALRSDGGRKEVVKYRAGRLTKAKEEILLHYASFDLSHMLSPKHEPPRPPQQEGCEKAIYIPWIWTVRFIVWGI